MKTKEKKSSEELKVASGEELAQVSGGTEIPGLEAIGPYSSGDTQRGGLEEQTFHWPK